jgi:hypothetical protein
MSTKSTSEQTKTHYYKITYSDTGRNNMISTTESLSLNRYYVSPTGRSFIVTGKAKLKYSMQDINSLVDILNEYDIGTIQYNMCNKFILVQRSNIPKITLTAEEKSVLMDILCDDPDITDEQEKVLRKILNK